MQEGLQSGSRTRPNIIYITRSSVILYAHYSLQPFFLFTLPSSSWCHILPGLVVLALPSVGSSQSCEGKHNTNKFILENTWISFLQITQNKLNRSKTCTTVKKTCNYASWRLHSPGQRSTSVRLFLCIQKEKGNSLSKSFYPSVLPTKENGY